jgi:hypothetical protein
MPFDGGLDDELPLFAFAGAFSAGQPTRTPTARTAATARKRIVDLS